MWDLSSLARNWTHVPCIRRWILNQKGKPLHFCSFLSRFLQYPFFSFLFYFPYVSLTYLCFFYLLEHMRHIHSSCFNPGRLASESGTFSAWILWQHFGWQETFLFVFWFLAVFRSLWLPADHVLVEKIKYGRKPGLGIAWREHVSRSVVSDS